MESSTPFNLENAYATVSSFQFSVHNCFWNIQQQDHRPLSGRERIYYWVSQSLYVKGMLEILATASCTISCLVLHSWWDEFEASVRLRRRNPSSLCQNQTLIRAVFAVSFIKRRILGGPNQSLINLWSVGAFPSFLLLEEGDRWKESKDEKKNKKFSSNVL